MNHNVQTGIPFGVISLASLGDWVVDELCSLPNPEMDANLEDYLRGELWDKPGVDNELLDDLDYSELAALADDILGLRWCEGYYDELVSPFVGCEGEIDGVSVRVTELGGALLVWVFESPIIGWYSQCSPCVPGAGNLDSPNPDGIECYDVPAGWRQ